MTEYPAQPIDYDRRSKDPASWHSVGFTLYFAADVLWKRLRPTLGAWRPGARLTEEQELALRLRGPFAMLAGLAIENMLKGAIVQAMPRRERKMPPKTHNLLTLSAAAKVDWNKSRMDVLKRLTTFVEWAGRYPVALTAEKSQEPRILKSEDYLTIIEVAGRLHDMHLGK